jgi:hypothetical protein
MGVAEPNGAFRETCAPKVWGGNHRYQHTGRRPGYVMSLIVRPSIILLPVPKSRFGNTFVVYEPTEGQNFESQLSRLCRKGAPEMLVHHKKSALTMRAMEWIVASRFVQVYLSRKLDVSDSSAETNRTLSPRLRRESSAMCHRKKLEHQPLVAEDRCEEPARNGRKPANGKCRSQSVSNAGTGDATH